MNEQISEVNVDTFINPPIPYLYTDDDIRKEYELIKDKKKVAAVYLISGSYDLLVTIEGRTLREAAQFVSDKLSPLESVLSTKTNFILKKYKDHGTIMAEKEKDERMLMTP